MGSDQRQNLFTRWQAAILSVLSAGVLVGVIGVALALVIGYRTPEGQSALVWSSSILSVASLGVLVTLLVARNRSSYGRDA